MIKVVSYNIHKGIGLDRQRNPMRIIEVIRELDADIVALQEADRRFGDKAGILSHALLAEQGDWCAVALDVRAPSVGWHGNVLLVRRAAAVAHSQILHLPALEPRGAVVADVDHGGLPLRVVGMHLDLSGLWRRRQAGTILSHVAAAMPRRPTVMMGDLNEWTAGSGCLRDFGRDFDFAATGPSFHARKPVGRLDRIMVSRDLRVVECGVHASATARKASDHLPIWAVLERV